METENVATETSPATSMLPIGKPSLAWAVWAGVVFLVAGAAGVIAFVTRKKDKKTEEEKSPEKTGEIKS